MLIKLRKVQSTLEYATLVTIVIGALLWMKGFLQKRLQGKLRYVGEEFSSEAFDASTRTSINTVVDTHVEETEDGIATTSNRSTKSHIETRGQ